MTPEAPFIAMHVLAMAVLVALLADTAYFWRRLRVCEPRRRFANMLCPVSQLVLVGMGVALADQHMIDPPFSFALVLMGGIAAVYDIALARTLVVAEEAEVERARVASLREELAARESRHRAASERERDRQAVGASAARLFERVAEHLEAGRTDHVDGMLRRVSAEVDALGGPWCDDPAVDAALFLKARACATAGVGFEARIDLAGKGGAISDVELVTLVSYAIDAVLATARASSRLRIRLRLSHGYVDCAVECLGADGEAPMDREALRIVRAVADGREGDVRVQTGEGFARLSAIV